LFRISVVNRQIGRQARVVSVGVVVSPSLSTLRNGRVLRPNSFPLGLRYGTDGASSLRGSNPDLCCVNRTVVGFSCSVGDSEKVTPPFLLRSQASLAYVPSRFSFLVLSLSRVTLNFFMLRFCCPDNQRPVGFLSLLLICSVDRFL